MKFVNPVRAVSAIVLPVMLFMGMVANAMEFTDFSDEKALTEEKPKEGKGNIEHDRMRAFRSADRDRDGALNFEEFSSMKRLVHLEQAKREKIFNKLDKNGDGRLRMRELYPMENRRKFLVMKHFDRLDKDSSGGLSYAEFKMSPLAKQFDLKQLEKHFAKLDKNGSGELERKELSKLGERRRPPSSPRIAFKKHDKDQSGGLSFDEYSAIPFINKISEERRRRMFKRVDANNDQELSPGEIRRAGPPRSSPHRGGRDHPRPKPPLSPEHGAL